MSKLLVTECDCTNRIHVVEGVGHCVCSFDTETHGHIFRHTDRIEPTTPTEYIYTDAAGHRK